MTLKVLNLYAGLGGNRKLWSGDIEVIAVELDPIIANEYQKNFPQDKVIVGDAKDYLLKHFQEFDFIWASPSCITHTRFRLLWQGDKDADMGNKFSAPSFKLPDMELYSIIIFLDHFFKGDWVVENVISYYKPLIRPYEAGGHYFWSNRHITPIKMPSRGIQAQDFEKRKKELDIPIPETGESDRFNRRLLNNCVHPKLGLHVLKCVLREQQSTIKMWEADKRYFLP